jgi:spore maturation protein CgeB
MKLLMVNTDYPEFLDWFYAQHKGLQEQPYEEQVRVRAESLFGLADFYSSNLRKLGHEASDIFLNNESMQKMWAREHGLPREKDLRWRLHRRRSFVPWFSRVRKMDWVKTILAAQVNYYRPDVLINLAMDGLAASFLREIKPRIRFLAGVGEPPVLYKQGNWEVYDLILAPSEAMADHFRKAGIKSELLRFAFEPRADLSLPHTTPRTIPVSFVGSLGKQHTRRHALLESLCERMDQNIHIWAPSVDGLNKGSPICRRYQGTAWGTFLYRILSSSRLTLNCHIDIAGDHADNMRLFEATGMGALLLTDWKKNLHTMFDTEMEVVTYKSREECGEKVAFYLSHDNERAAIAQAGRKRTFREHTYYHRMQELLDILKKYL